MRYVPFALPQAAMDARLQTLRWTFRKWDTHVRGRATVARGALALTAEEHAGLARAGGPRVTRVDLFLTAEGWRASECNDDVPGGYNDALGLPALFADAVEKGMEPPGDLPDALARLFAGARRIGMVYATAYAEDMQVVRLLADLLEMHGFETVLASPAHLEHAEGRTTLAGEPVDIIYR